MVYHNKEFDKNVETIRFELDSYKDKNYLTHNFHPYPAKFIPQIPRQLIEKLSKKEEIILDPFCGVGTTLVEAKLLGRNSIGVDINPLACLVSKVKTTLLNHEEIKEIKKILSHISLDINSLYNRTLIPHEPVEPEIPDFYNRDYWFKDFVLRELGIIKAHIKNIKNEKIKDFITVAFSAIINPVSNQESDTRYVAINKNLYPTVVLKFFSAKLKDMIERMGEFEKMSTNSWVKVYCHNATDLSFIENKSIDLVVTSPPYLNTYDYYLYHKHRMQWLEMNYKIAQKYEIGSRHKHSDKNESISSYIDSVSKVFNEVNRVLKKGRYCCIVIGDAIKNGELIRMNKVMDCIMLNKKFLKMKQIIYKQRKYSKSFTPNIKKLYDKNSYILVYKKL